METIKQLSVAEIGYSFESTTRLSFFSKQNLFEYDLIVINVGRFMEETEQSELSAIQDKIKDFNNFALVKQIPIIFLYPELSRNFVVRYGTGLVHMTLGEILNSTLQTKPIHGQLIEVLPNTPFTDFLNQYKAQLKYETYFENHGGTVVAKANSQSHAIAFFTDEYLFLPILSYPFEHEILEIEFFNDLIFSWKESSQSATEPLPDWAAKYTLPGDLEERTQLADLEEAYKQIKHNIAIQIDQINLHTNLKTLFYAGGDTLETAVQYIFEELGFTILAAEPNRDDLIMQWNNQIVITEIKGLSKSAAEKNSAQLEKWVSNYYAAYDVKPKGLLIVNTFRETELMERTQDSFPHQMLKYATDREHCLINSIQLLGLLFEVRKNPDSKEDLINELVTTKGIYNRFADWNEYIKLDQPS
jgi:hypothetical protein